MAAKIVHTHTHKNFEENKQRILAGKDLSIKGSVDDSILELVNLINDNKNYVTTSSCSGRVVVVARSQNSKDGVPASTKKSCDWLFTSHNIFDPNELVQAIVPQDGEVYLKFEPFILHVLCSSVQMADKLMKTAYGVGYRESGLTISKNERAMVAIRSNTQLAVPLCCNSQLLVTKDYLDFLAKTALEKLEENNIKIARLFKELKNMLEGLSEEGHS